MIRATSRGIAETLFLGTLIFAPLAFGATEPWSRALLELLLFATLLTAAGAGLVPQAAWRHPFAKAVVLLLIVGAAQLLGPRRNDGPSGILLATSAPYETKRALVLWGACLAGLICVPSIMTSRESIRRFAWCLLLLGAFVAIVGIVQRAQGNTAYYGIRPILSGWPFGPYTNRDHAAAMLMISFFVGVGLVLSLVTRATLEPSAGRSADCWAKAAIAAGGLVVIALGILETRSRGGHWAWLLACLPVSAAMVGRAKNVARRYAGYGLAFGAALVVAWYCLRNPYWTGHVFEDQMDTPTAYRVAIYRGALKLILDNPMGVGVGAVQTAFFPYTETIIKGVVDHVHCDWLELALQVGWIPAIVILALVGKALIQGIRFWRCSPSLELAWLALGALGALMGFAIHSAVDFNLEIPANAILIVAIAGFLVAVSREEAPERSRHGGANRFLASASLAGMIVAARGEAAAALVWRAADAPSPAAAAGMYERATRWDDAPFVHYAAAASVLAGDAGSPQRALGQGILALRADPLNAAYRRVVGGALWRLGRAGDGREFASERP